MIFIANDAVTYVFPASVGTLYWQSSLFLLLLYWLDFELSNHVLRQDFLPRVYRTRWYSSHHVFLEIERQPAN